MKNRILISLAVSIALLMLLPAGISASEKKSEMRFQLGFGAMVSTGNLLGMIENVKLAKAIEADRDYAYPGVSEEEAAALNKLEGSMQRAILVANILGSMEYGLNMRILWSMLIFEADLVLLPFDGSYNGRLDFQVNLNGGIRAPFWIMPYITLGPTFTFSFYPREFTTLENWKSRWAATDNFAFRPGINSRVGLDFKFPKFSIGAYYQYTVKDFEEFRGWYYAILDEGVTATEAAGMIFGAQSRFGAALCWYLF